MERGYMNSSELFEEMKQLWNDFETNHNGTSKAAKQRARKYIGELKKMVVEYRKASIEETK